MTHIARTCLHLLVVLSIASMVKAAPIHDAVRSGNAKEVRRLLTADSSIANAVTSTGDMPLNIACWAGALDVVELLLDAGANIEASNSQSMTPLRAAIYMMKPDVVKLLLDRGARTDSSHPMFGSVMNQAFSVTCQKGGNPTLVEMLMAHGLQLHAGKVDAMGMAPLDWAVHFGNLAMARLALEHGADARQVSPQLGRPPLVIAVSKGNGEIVDLLLEHGADASSTDQLGYPPSFYAVEQGRKEILANLFSHGATIDFAEPHFGRSLLHLAAIKGYRDIAEMIVTKGAIVDAADKESMTPLYYALKYQNNAVANYLKEQGAVKPEGVRTPPSPSERLEPAEAIVLYLNNRGWVVRTQMHEMIFDAEEFGIRRSDNPCLANGFLTKSELQGQNVIGIYSCYHGNPGEPAFIHTLADSLEEIAFVHLLDDAWRGSPNTAYLTAGADTTVGDLRIQAIDIGNDMPMLAYLCHSGDLTVYYQAFATSDTSTLGRGYEFLREKVDTVDIAFLPMPESEQETSDVRLFLERFPTRAIVLHDPDRRDYMLPGAARQVSRWGYPAEVHYAENPGDYFRYSAQRR